MGLLARIRQWGRRSRPASKSQSQSALASRRWRICRFEEVEPRQLLSATVNPIQVGSVYYEDHNEQDSTPDVIRITFKGGAEGTQLTKLTIDTDKAGDGLTIGDTFFDTAAGGNGVYGYAPLSIISQTGIDSVAYTLSADGTELTFTFAGFDAGETLVFSIDVDEMGFLGANAVAEGNEFEGSMLYATFAADHYYEASGNDMFLDYYDDKLGKTSLNLPSDSYSPPATESQPIYTAGAIFTVQQQALPITLSGTVFEDMDSDNVQDSVDKGIAGVTVSLLVLENGTYVSTGLTAVTDSNGYYAFDDLDPGTYRVVETQPSGYVSVGATAGKVDGSTRGSVESADVITQVTLEGGDESVHNDFAEARYANLSGYVYYDADNDGVMDSGENGIAGATVYLLNSAGTRTTSTVTDSSGYYKFSNLTPGTYGLEEVQPTDYLDGKDSLGSAGGTLAAGGDKFTAITLVSNQSGTLYNFGEILPASLSGHVAVDSDGDGVYDKGEPTLAGVTLRLLDEDGNLVATTVTDANGQYSFTGLYPGVYRVEEVQPSGYFDGADSVGSAGGTLDPDDAIDAIPLSAGTHATDYDFLELEPVSLSGYVYVDDSNDGVFDSGESPIAGVKITLRDSAGNAIATTTTDSSGYYEFTGLEPNKVYGVAETQPDGYRDGLDTAGNLGGTVGNDTITDVSIAAGKKATEYNFGELRPASISGKVYADENQNEDYDAGDKLLSGVTVYLLNSSGERIASTVTNSQGYYEFTNLVPGVYGVEEIQPADYFDGADQIGSAGGKRSGTDTMLGAKLSSGVAATDYDFGEIAPASISGYVFQDGDTITTYVGVTIDVYALRDGQLTSDDTRLAGIKLQLADKNGNAILDGNGQAITAVTDASGYYEFTGLKPGTYTVIEVQPTGYITGANTAGSNGGLPLDPVHSVDATILAELAIPADSDAILRITVGAGDAAVLNNFSEILVKEIDEPDNPPGGSERTPEFVDLGLPATVIGTPDPHITPLDYSPSATRDVLVALYGGGGIDPIAYTWHLTVIDAGLPRRDQVGPEGLAQVYSSAYFNPVSWTGSDVSQSLWLLADADGRPVRQLRFGLENAFPVAGDWNGDGSIEVGVFLNGLWFLDLNGNGIWDNGDLWAQMGQIGDQAVTGDWDGDGKTDLGILGPAWAGDSRALAAEPGLPDVSNLFLVSRYKNVPPDPDQAPVAMRTMKRSSQGKIRADLIDHVFRFGREGDIAIAGDWNGDGITNIGLFRSGAWYLDADGNGKWTADDIFIENFGQAGDIPVVGDWTGDGVTKVGVYRRGTWYLDTNNNHVIDSEDKVIQLGGPGDIPVVGDWNGEGFDKVGIYRSKAPKSEQQASTRATDQRDADVAPHVADNTAANAKAAATTAARPAADAATVRK